MIFVSINYRLNIFSFGDGKEKNLALKDQRLGIDWVRKNIASFGGDPVSIFTLSIRATLCLSDYRIISLYQVRVLGLFILMPISSQAHL